MGSMYLMFFLLFFYIIVISTFYSFKNFNKFSSLVNFFEETSFIKFFSLIFYLLLYMLLLFIIFFFFKTNILNPQVLDFQVIDPFFFKSGLFKYFPNFLLLFSIDLFGLLILFLAYTVGALCLIALGNKYYHDNEYVYLYFFFFLLVITILVSTNNMILWIFMYECLLLPSALIVLKNSSSRRSIQAALYFIIFTQIGSFLVVCVLSYIIATKGVFDFKMLNQIQFNNLEYFFMYFFLFIGFGIKIPIWPFHHWLTKTHVEASAGFSMFLSGFLVKVAALGFYKFAINFGNQIDISIFIVICLMGVMDSSLKLFSQTDIKKLVAYCTILEMNLIYLAIIWGDSYFIFGGLIFIYTHGFLSSLMFFLVDCIQKRYGSRNVTAICGILHTTPNLAIGIFIMFIIFSGLPGTTKFMAELIIFLYIYNFSPILVFFLIFFVNILGLIGFSKIWFNTLFGMSNRYADSNIIDLNFTEFLIIFICCFFLIIMIFCPIF